MKCGLFRNNDNYKQFGGARGVMVNVVGTGYGNTNSIPG